MATKTAKEENPLAEERCGNVREVGNPAVWSLSSCKPGKQERNGRKHDLFHKISKFQDSALNNYGTIAWTRTGSPMANYRTW